MTTTLGINIERNLEYISNTYIQPEQRNSFLGEKKDESLIKDLLDYDTFKNNWLNTGLTTLPNDLLNNVYFKKTNWVNGNTFYSGSDTNNKLTLDTYTYNNDVSSINFSKIVSTVQSAGNKTLNKIEQGTSSFNNLLDLLNAIRVTYNILEPAMYKKFVEGTLTTLSTYELNSTNNGYVQLTGTQTTTVITAITSYTDKILNNFQTLDLSKTNVDAVRRILLGYECMIHIYIAMFLYENSSDDDKTFCKNLLETCISYFNQFNLNIFDNTTTTGLNVLYSGLEDRIKTYQNSKSEINSLNENLQKVKTDIQIEKNYIDSHSKYYTNNQIVFYLVTILFLILLVVLLFNNAIGISDESIRQQIPFAILIVSIILLILVYLTTRFIIREPFVATDTDIPTYNVLSLKVFDEYITHTVNIIRVIQTYRGYGDISYAIRKEQHYYTGLESQLEQNKDALYSIQTEKYRQASILRYRVFLFIQILLTLSIYMVLANYNPAFSNINITLGVIAAFTMLFWVYLYLVNINNLVRTDPRKLYWGQPSPNLLN